MDCNIFSVGIDTLYLYGFADDGVNSTSPKDEIVFHGLHCEQQRGTRHHKYGWRDTEHDPPALRLFAGARSDVNRESAGDYRIEYGQEVLVAWREYETPICPSLHARLSRALVQLGCCSHHAKINRVDVAFDAIVTGDLRIAFDQISTVSSVKKYFVGPRDSGPTHDAPGWREWEERRRGRPATWTGFRIGSRRAPFRLALYDKGEELRACHPARLTWYSERYPELAPVLSDTAQWWRVEFRLRGQALTDWELRDWTTVQVRLPVVLRTLASRTRILSRPKKRYNSGRWENAQQIPMHPLWRAVTEAIPTDERTLRRRSTHAFIAGASLAHRQLQTATERWESYRAVYKDLGARVVLGLPSEFCTETREETHRLETVMTRPTVDVKVLKEKCARIRTYYDLQEVDDDESTDK